jgi:hypothetical protein
MGFAGGFSLYTCAGNNRATYTDPFGLCEPFCTALDAAFVAADINEIRKKGWSWGRGLALGADVLAAAVPLIPSLVGATSRTLSVGTRLTQGNRRMGLEHIVLNHWHSAGVAGKSRFGSDVGVNQLKSMIEGATGRWRIGTDAAGDATSWLRIVTNRSGEVITAYPIRGR